MTSSNRYPRGGGGGAANRRTPLSERSPTKPGNGPVGPGAASHGDCFCLSPIISCNPRSIAITSNHFLAMNRTENTCAGNRKNRPKWPMLWAFLAMYRRCFFTLHYTSTLHLLCWDGPCRFRFHLDGCTCTVQPGRSIVANETSRCIHLVSQTMSDVCGRYVIDNVVYTTMNLHHQRIVKFCGRGLPCSFTANSRT